VASEIKKLIRGAVPVQRWRARAVIDRESDAVWTLHLVTEIEGKESRSNVREMAATSCAQLASAAAVVLAIDVDPARAAQPAPADEPSAPSSPPESGSRQDAPLRNPLPPVKETPSAPDQAPAQLPPSGASHPRTFAIAVLAGGSAGVLATPAFGTGLGAAWFPSRFRIEVDGQWFPASRVQGTLPGTAGDFDLMVVGLTACWSVVAGRANLATCVGADGGRLRAMGIGSAVAVSNTVDTLWLATKVGGLLTWSATSALALRLDVDLVFPLVRHRFLVVADNSVHTPNPIAAQTLAGIEVRFP
jgi:hypothetical protein